MDCQNIGGKNTKEFTFSLIGLWSPEYRSSHALLFNAMQITYKTFLPKIWWTEEPWEELTVWKKAVSFWGSWILVWLLSYPILKKACLLGFLMVIMITALIWAMLLTKPSCLIFTTTLCMTSFFLGDVSHIIWNICLDAFYFGHQNRTELNFT